MHLILISEFFSNERLGKNQLHKQLNVNILIGKSEWLPIFHQCFKILLLTTLAPPNLKILKLKKISKFIFTLLSTDKVDENLKSFFMLPNTFLFIPASLTLKLLPEPPCRWLSTLRLLPNERWSLPWWSWSTLEDFDERDDFDDRALLADNRPVTLRVPLLLPRLVLGRVLGEFLAGGDKLCILTLILKYSHHLNSHAKLVSFELSFV